jgi:hypothetical protein
MRPQLTKSLFIRSYDCPLRLRHALDGLPSRDDANHYVRLLAEGGFQFEKLVRLAWPGNCMRACSGPPEEAAQATLDQLRVLRESCGVLHEAQFAHGDFFTRVDMLRIQGDELLLCEIKSRAVNGPAHQTQHRLTSTDGDVGILQKRRGGVASEWRLYVADIAFQVVVVERALRAAGLGNLKVNPRLVLANSNAHGNQFDRFGNVRRKAAATSPTHLTEADFEFVLEPDPAFVSAIISEVDVSEAVRRLRKVSAQSNAESWRGLTLETLMSEMTDVLRGGGPAADRERGWKCASCEYRVKKGSSDLGAPTGFAHCWNGFAEQAESLFELYYGGSYQPNAGKANQRWVHEHLRKAPPGVANGLRVLPRDRSGGARANTRNLQIRSHAAGTTESSADFAGLVESRLLPAGGSGTLHFIDFETATACLPYEHGMRPYEIVAFQFSSHTGKCSDGVLDGASIRHQEWLDSMTDGGDPGRSLQSIDRQFVDALRTAIGDQGPVLHWAAHERTVLRVIGDRLEPGEDSLRINWLRELAGEASHDHGRLVDMRRVAEGHVMTPHQRGRYSMKQLLPAACREDHVWLGLCELMQWRQHAHVPAKERDPYRLLPPLPVCAGGRSAIRDATNADDGYSPDEAEPGAGVRCGTDAIRAFQQLRYGGDSAWGDVDKETLRGALTQYCKLDTAAMVAAWRWMTSVAASARLK